MWKQSDNILHRLFSRQISSGRPNTHIHRVRELYENVVPSHTVYEVDCPDQCWRRFTNDGQYLICFSKTYHDLLIYRPLWPTYCSTLDSANDLPSKSKKFESYFSLLHQIPLARDADEVICKDFFLCTENNLYGIFATSTDPDPNAAASNGSVPGVPSIEKITFLVVRFADGVITGRSVFKDDYIHLAHNAGVFLHEDLLAVLSIRFQCIHILQVREGGLFLDVRSIGDFCRDDDELLLNSQAQAEAKFQEEQRQQLKARGRVHETEVLVPVPQSIKTNGLKPLNTLNDRKRPRIRDSRAAHDDFGTSRGHPQFFGEGSVAIQEIDILYDGYFRGLFTVADGPIADAGRIHGNGGMRTHSNGEYNNHALGNPHIRGFRSHLGANPSRHSNSNNHVRTFPASEEAGNHTSLEWRHLVSDRDHSSYDISHGRRFETVAQNGSRENLSGRLLISARDRATYDNPTSRWNGNNLSSSGNLYSSGGSDLASHSYNSTTDRGSSEATTLHELSSHREEPGSSERRYRPVPSLSTSGRSMAAPNNLSRSVFRDDFSLDDPSMGRSRSRLGGEDQVTNSSGTSLGRVGQTGSGNFGTSYATIGQDNARGDGTQTGNAAATGTGGNEVQEGSQILRGLKQRLLSFILQGIVDDEDISPAVSQRLKRFYFNFQQYVDLVMWKVQFLDRCHLLVKFGSVNGVVLRNSETSHQIAFLAVYNMETTEILSFYQQNSSEELLQLVEQYWDHFRMVPQNPQYMRFISSYANNGFAREQLRKQKAACLSGKAGSYAQSIKRTLASLPHNSQSQSPSAYFDQYLFHYDEKLISSTDRHKPCAEHPIKFVSRRRPNLLKFKINPGLELGSNDGHIKRVASYLFHPIYPFAISVQQSFMQTSIVNFHFRR
ncbi:light-mediated development protein DET1 isoform X3 [Physcomitrium patens]|uniref:light-mediated development protein DET1 isoform X3 n=1 Tax=Physcomitrium patens TaxID=3218 RepID=UPI003CCD305B